ncbi:hypothetical protein B296_00016452 [Ensete ventricosum]|uniref:Uncharacterized protein n=1 Tax=Ensete ventricosum TaxID=4639 RepID=A0A426YY88_ENSVE|nr:hypothetical protein B296_00016452 [Ensete ventricosum]
MLKDVLPQPLVLIRRPQPFPMLRLRLLPCLAPHSKAILTGRLLLAGFFQSVQGLQKSSACWLLLQSVMPMGARNLKFKLLVQN